MYDGERDQPNLDALLLRRLYERAVTVFGTPLAQTRRLQALRVSAGCDRGE